MLHETDILSNSIDNCKANIVEKTGSNDYDESNSCGQCDIAINHDECENQIDEIEKIKIFLIETQDRNVSTSDTINCTVSTITSDNGQSQILKAYEDGNSGVFVEGNNMLGTTIESRHENNLGMGEKTNNINCNISGRTPTNQRNSEDCAFKQGDKIADGNVLSSTISYEDETENGDLSMEGTISARVMPYRDTTKNNDHPEEEMVEKVVDKESDINEVAGNECVIRGSFNKSSEMNSLSLSKENSNVNTNVPCLMPLVSDQIKHVKPTEPHNCPSIYKGNKNQNDHSKRLRKKATFVRGAFPRIAMKESDFKTVMRLQKLLKANEKRESTNTGKKLKHSNSMAISTKQPNKANINTAEANEKKAMFAKRRSILSNYSNIITKKSNKAIKTSKKTMENNAKRFTDFSNGMNIATKKSCKAQRITKEKDFASDLKENFSYMNTQDLTSAIKCKQLQICLKKIDKTVLLKYGVRLKSRSEGCINENNLSLNSCNVSETYLNNEMMCLESRDSEFIENGTVSVDSMKHDVEFQGINDDQLHEGAMAKKVAEEKFMVAKVNITKIDDKTLIKYGYNPVNFKSPNASVKKSPKVGKLLEMKIRKGRQGKDKANDKDNLNNILLKYSSSTPKKVSGIDQVGGRKYLKPNINPDKIWCKNSNKISFSTPVTNNHSDSTRLKVASVVLTKLDDTALSKNAAFITKPCVPSEHKSNITNTTGDILMRNDDSVPAKQNVLDSKSCFAHNAKTRTRVVRNISDICTTDRTKQELTLNDKVANISAESCDTMPLKNLRRNWKKDAGVSDDRFFKDYCKENLSLNGKYIHLKYPRINLIKIDNPFP